MLAEFVHDGAQLDRYLIRLAGDLDRPSELVVSAKRPLLIDSYLTDAVEVDVDCLSDGKDTFIVGIMEHIEEAGIHSGDSCCAIPPYSLPGPVIQEIRQATIAMPICDRIDSDRLLRNSCGSSNSSSTKSTRTACKCVSSCKPIVSPKDAEPPHALALLRACRERPRRRRAAEQRDELATFQLIELHLISADQYRVAGYRARHGPRVAPQSAVPNQHSDVCRPKAKV